MILLKDQIDNKLKELGVNGEIIFQFHNLRLVGKNCGNTFTELGNIFPVKTKYTKKEREVIAKKIIEMIENNLEEIKSNYEILIEREKVLKELQEFEINLKKNENIEILDNYSNYTVTRTPIMIRFHKKTLAIDSINFDNNSFPMEELIPTIRKFKEYLYKYKEISSKLEKLNFINNKKIC